MLRPSIFNGSFADNMFDEFFNDPFWPTARMSRSTPGMMNTDVRENEHDYQIDMELPGFAKEDVKAELKDGYLTIKADHQESKDEKDEGGRYLRRERFTGKCQRRFYVGEAVTQNDIKAKFTDGILTVMVPKKEADPAVEEKKYIAIEG